MNALAPYISPLPLIAVLRHITVDEAIAVGTALHAEGFRILEVPLNSPRPLESIRVLAERFGSECLIGAGTVLAVEDVARVREAGGRVIVMPHADTAVIREAKRQGMVCVPGVATPTEAFAALAAGADGLKMFPAEGMPPPVLKAWRAVLPEAFIFVVGGIRPDNMTDYWKAGATGFGTGSNLFKPGTPPEKVREVAAAFAAAVKALPAR
jgi:2-dehydro-3-deoxyphosphogalactonate aldolase